MTSLALADICKLWSLFDFLEWQAALCSAVCWMLANLSIHVRSTALNSAVDAALVIQRRVQQRRLFLHLCFSNSKHVGDNNAKRFLPSTHLLRICAILYWTISIFICLADSWLLTLTTRYYMSDRPSRRLLCRWCSGRAYATVFRPSVCLWRYVLWLNGAS